MASPEPAQYFFENGELRSLTSENAVLSSRTAASVGHRKIRKDDATTRFERATFAFGGQATRLQSRRNASNQTQDRGAATPRATTPQRTSLLRAMLPCEPRYGSFMTSTADGKVWARAWMSRHQLPRLDSDQDWAGRPLSKTKSYFGGGSNGRFGSRKVKNALSFNGD